MAPEPDTVTIIWQHRKTGVVNRVTAGKRTTAFLAFSVGLLLLGTAFLGGWALYISSENAGLRAQLQTGERHRSDLADRLKRADAAMESAREELIRVRSEEAKIRSWLGLEELSAPSGEDSVTEGGQGSLEDVDLEAVSPKDRATEAAAPARAPAMGLAEAAKALGADLEDLARRVGERKQAWDSVPTISPVDGEHWISSAFGWRRSPFTGKREFHSGTDMAGQRGLPIVAAAAGKVSRIVRDPALGRAVILEHGKGIQTIYGHLEEVKVKKGQGVVRGQPIATMGSSGRRSTGPHLHYAIKVDGKYVNPDKYMLDRGGSPFVTAEN